MEFIHAKNTIGNIRDTYKLRLRNIILWDAVATEMHLMLIYVYLHCRRFATFEFMLISVVGYATIRIKIKLFLLFIRVWHAYKKGYSTKRSTL